MVCYYEGQRMEGYICSKIVLVDGIFVAMVILKKKISHNYIFIFNNIQV